MFIGFTGVKRAGKTTAFTFIKDKYPEVREIALADKLKSASATIFGIPKSAFDAVNLKERELDVPVYLTSEAVSDLISYFGVTPDFEKHVRPHLNQILYTPRQIAQYVGTEILRNVDYDIHCKSVTSDLPEDGIFIVTDMRFPNEYDFFSLRYERDFYPYYICNNRAELGSRDDTHASEKHVFDIVKKCHQIDNNGSLEDLRKNVLKEFESVLELYKNKGL